MCCVLVITLCYLASNFLSVAYFRKLKIKEALDLSLNSKKMIDELKPDEQNEIYQHHEDGKIRQLMTYLWTKSASVLFRISG